MTSSNRLVDDGIATAAEFGVYADEKWLIEGHGVDVVPGSGIQPHNHLRYSPRVWNGIINTPLMSYNRLKAPDYRALVEEAGFAIRHFEVEPGSAADLASNEDVKEFYLGLSAGARKNYRDAKHYRRRKRWLA